MHSPPFQILPGKTSPLNDIPTQWSFEFLQGTQDTFGMLLGQKYSAKLRKNTDFLHSYNLGYIFPANQLMRLLHWLRQSIYAAAEVCFSVEVGVFRKILVIP